STGPLVSTLASAIGCSGWANCHHLRNAKAPIVCDSAADTSSGTPQARVAHGPHRKRTAPLGDGPASASRREATSIGGPFVQTKRVLAHFPHENAPDGEQALAVRPLVFGQMTA